MIKVGDRIPEGTLKTMTGKGPKAINTNEIFAGKKVVFFGVPGAFTPTCSKTHLTGYLNNIEAIKASGFDEVCCMAVNDVYVMDAWAQHQDANDKVTFLADGSAEFTKALGLELDLNHVGMGLRSKRFSLVVNDGVIEAVNVDARTVDSTSAESTCSL